MRYYGKSVQHGCHGSLNNTIVYDDGRTIVTFIMINDLFCENEHEQRERERETAVFPNVLQRKTSIFT